MDNTRFQQICGVLSYLQSENIASELFTVVLVHYQFNGPEDIFLPDPSHSTCVILSVLYHHHMSWHTHTV